MFFTALFPSNISQTGRSDAGFSKLPFYLYTAFLLLEKLLFSFSFFPHTKPTIKIPGPPFHCIPVPYQAVWPSVDPVSSENTKKRGEPVKLQDNDPVCFPHPPAKRQLCIISVNHPGGMTVQKISDDFLFALRLPLFPAGNWSPALKSYSSRSRTISGSRFKYAPSARTRQSPHPV